MLRHEKIAFLKFFIAYFVSVALLILAAGYFYFSQMQSQLLKFENFSLIEYARHLKMHKTLEEFSSDYFYKIVHKNREVPISNFKITSKEFIKLIPHDGNKLYLQLHKSNQGYYDKLWELKKRIIFIQLLLLLFFALLSYVLAKNALKPLNESIETLDRFIKDLIHDLNTPVTAIKLNMNLLNRQKILQDNRIYERIKQSVNSISELHENLTILLQSETFQVEKIEVCEVVEEVIGAQRTIHPHIQIINDCSNCIVKVNRSAIKQILQNIISNACQYNKQNGYVKIYNKENSLYIEDSGQGIQEPEKIFTRNYSANNSSGLGLDIVKRLSEALQIEIKIEGTTNGTTFILIFQ